MVIGWGNFGVFTFLYTPNLKNAAEFEAKLSGIYDEFCAPIFKQYGISFVYRIQKITDIHLHSHYEGEANGDIKYVYIFSAVAIFMLIIASISHGIAFRALSMAHITSSTVLNVCFQCRKQVPPRGIK